MQIILNQSPYALSEGATIETLLQETGVSRAFIAVAVNQSIIPKERWTQHLLHEGDKVMLITAAKGG